MPAYPMRFAALVAFLTVLAACRDDDPLAPFETPAADPVPSTLARAALQDAIDRIVPTLESGPAATALYRGLVTALEKTGRASSSAITSALDRLASEQPGVTMELDAVRLALHIDP